MKISKALKRISKLKGEIADLSSRITASNSCMAENDFREDVKKLISEYRNKVTELLGLKEAVMKANVSNGIYHNILLLSEKKSEIQMLKDMDIKSGKELSHGYNDAVYDYKCQIGLEERNEIVDILEKEVEDIIDSLDEFNATHEV